MTWSHTQQQQQQQQQPGAEPQRATESHREPQRATESHVESRVPDTNQPWAGRWGGTWHEQYMPLWWMPPSGWGVGGSGIILTAVADLDRETQDRYELVVKATDMAGQMGGLSGSTTVTIVITD
ncbi:hypothetical protein CRUP_037824, partial [Coryphaenoides rupestris]